MAEARRIPEIAIAVPGFHLEGPYISTEEGYRGAHNPDEIRLPDWDEFTNSIKRPTAKFCKLL